MLNHPMWMISPIQKTNVTQIFIPKGEITLNADYATLRLTQNVSALYEESRKLCQTSNIIEEFVAKKIPKGLSTQTSGYYVYFNKISEIPVKKLLLLGLKLPTHLDLPK